MAGSTIDDSELVEIAPMTALGDASAITKAVAAPTTGRSRVPVRPAWAVRSDRTWILIAFAAIAGLAVVGVMDLFVPATTSVRLDPSLDGVGVRSATLSLVPITLVGVLLASLVAYARQGRWRRRFGVLGLVVVVGWAMSVAVGDTMPVSRDRDRGWVSDGGEVAFTTGGLMENVTYRLAPGEPFTMATTIRNPGALPLTVLGLDGIRTSQPNPYIASIVSLGWVPQPIEGSITYLSANAEDASASWPVTLAPGEELAVVIVGRAGPCAEPQGIVTDLPLTHLGLRYRVLGLERTTDVGLPAVVFVTGKSPCTVEIPGGTVTYGNPGE
jgi:hypothetical protein